MKAVRLHGPREFRVDDVPEPEPGPGEVKIAVRSVGVCASDVHYYLRGQIGGLDVRRPFILGHEFAGVVQAVGQGVQGLRLGQPVTAEPVHPCGKCDCCLRGDYNLCRSLLFFGTPPADGCLCERVVCLAKFTFPLPEGITMDEGAMTEPLAVGLEAVAMAGIRGGESCAVLGAGAIGLSALQALKAAGAGRVVVSEPIPERRRLAEKLGADAVVPPEDAVGVVGGGLDFVVEAAGSPEAPQQAVELARPGGTVVLVGIPDDDTITFRASTARRKALTIRFVRRYRHRFRQALEMMADGRAKVSPYVTHIFSAKDTATAFDVTASRSSGVVRAVVRFAP